MDKKFALLSGMNRNPRIFCKFKEYFQNVSILDWIEPQENESIYRFAERLVSENNLKACNLLGVSFGGIVVQEMRKFMNAEHCFVVSSASSPKEFPLSWRTVRRARFLTNEATLKKMGDSASAWTRVNAQQRFTNLKKLAGEEGAWYRWAYSAIAKWNPSADRDDEGIVRIHGNQDRTFPNGDRFSKHVIKNAGHMLAMTHTAELVQIIKQYQLIQNQSLFDNA